MSIETSAPTGLEAALARLLSYGTWLASAVIAVGLVQTTFGWHVVAAGASNISLVGAGIAIFILLPVMRVVVMLFVFLRERDYGFGAAAAFVLIMMLVGCLIGAM